MIGMMKSSRLTGAGDKMLGVLSDAQQTAFANNFPVEVRFYKYAGILGSPEHFRSIQLFKVATAPKDQVIGNQNYSAGQEIITKLGPLIKLPEGVMISSDNDLSKALNGANDNGFEDSNSDSGVEGARYSAVRFMTDGTCRRVDSYNRGAQQKFAALSFMSLPESFLTVVEDDGKRYTGSGADAPKNFYTIQIDPYTGKSRSYRPGF